jgi:hypothetical protein
MNDTNIERLTFSLRRVMRASQAAGMELAKYPRLRDEPWARELLHAAQHARDALRASREARHGEPQVCQVCGEDYYGESCCGSDELPEPGEIRETGK